MQMTPDILMTIIKGLLCLIGAIMGLFVTMVGILHKGITKRLDCIELDIKPFIVELAKHGEQIKDIRDEQKGMHKWVNNHDIRIQTLERTIIHTRP